MHRFFVLLFGLLLVQPSGVSTVQATSEAVPLRIRFTGLRNTVGTIGMGIYRTQEEFETDKPFQSITLSKKGVKDGILVHALQLAPAVYAISVLDDENNNHQMDFNWMHIPKEGYGFSNYVHSGLVRPKVNKFQFRLQAPLEVVVKMQYW
jgi:hypothetical protein